MRRNIIFWLGCLGLFLGVFLVSDSTQAADLGEDLIENGMWSDDNLAVDSGDSNLVSHTDSANPLHFSFSQVWANGVRSTGSQVVINKDATLTFVISPQTVSTSNYTWTSNRKTVDASNTFDQFTMTFSIAAGKYFDLGTSGVSVHDGSATGSDPLNGKTYIAIGTSSSSLIQNTGGQLKVNRPIYITVDLGTAWTETIQTLTIKQQFNNTNASNSSNFIKVSMGVLNFTLTLKPTLTNIFMFPTPITVDGTTYTAIVTGKGTLEGDAIRYSTDGDATTSSPAIPETVPASKNWVWLVPESAGLTAGQQLSVLETSPEKDDSNTDTGDIDDNAKYLDNSGGQDLIDKLTDLIKKYKSGSADATELENIAKEIDTTLDDISNTIDLQKQVEASTGGYQISFENDQDYLFTDPTYNETTQGLISAKIAQTPTTSTTASLVDDKTGADTLGATGKEVTWHAYQHGTAVNVDQTGSNLVTVTPEENSNGTWSCKVTANQNVMDLKQIDLVATLTLGDSKFTISKEVSVINLVQNPTTIDVTQTTSGQLNLANIPADTENLKYTWTKIDAINANSVQVGSDQSSLNLAQLTYLNDGDWYQVAITKDGHTTYSNIVQLAISGTQQPNIIVTPSEMTFSDNGTAPRLDQIINGAFSSWNQPLTTDGKQFSFGSHTGSGTNWQIAASVAPFTTASGKKLGGNTQLKFKFRATYGQAGSGYSNNDGTGQESPAISDDNTSTVLFGAKATADFTLSGALSAKMIVQAPAAQATNYHSTITWTAGENTAVPAAK